MSSTLEQRRANLRRANNVRFSRAQLKRDLRVGVIDLRLALEHPAASSAWVIEILTTLPRVGHVKASKILSRCEISPARPCAMLTARQRELLAAELAR